MVLTHEGGGGGRDNTPSHHLFPQTLPINKPTLKKKKNEMLSASKQKYFGGILCSKTSQNAKYWAFS